MSLFFNRQDEVKCNGFGVCCGNNDPPLVLNTTAGRKCDGLDDKNCICGGTDRPKPCPGGYYCPTPNVRIPCGSGDYCRPGSTEPDPCPVRITKFVILFIAGTPNIHVIIDRRVDSLSIVYVQYTCLVPCMQVLYNMFTLYEVLYIRSIPGV